jgi:hypothetical protein
VAEQELLGEELELERLLELGLDVQQVLAQRLVQVLP